MEEKRASKRYPVAYPIEKSDDHSAYPFSLVDVSKGGVAFTTTEEIKRADVLNFHIFLKRKMFTLSAVVIHISSTGEGLYTVGARFLDASEDFYEVLNKELDEITQFHRECNLYKHKNMSFRTASAEYINLH